VPPNNINHQRLSVAATFYEPIYQRLRSWSDEKSEQILGFTSPTNPKTRDVLMAAGAVLSRAKHSECFAEVWNLSSEFKNRSADSLIELDRQISESLRCHNGRFTSTCGTMQWDDAFDEPHRRRHVISHLLEESRLPKPQKRER
jgi:hypothetical protein